MQRNEPIHRVTAIVARESAKDDGTIDEDGANDRRLRSLQVIGLWHTVGKTTHGLRRE